MTNDDRNEEQPRYGEREQPRYGERVSPEQGGAPRSDDQPTQQYQQQSAPQWGQHDQQQHQQYGQQQYGQPGDQYGQQQYSQQPQQYGNQQQAGAPAWHSYDEPEEKKKKTVGVIAFLAAVVALVIGAVGGYLLGTALSNSQVLQDYAQNGGSGNPADTQELQRQLMQDPESMAGLGTGSVLMLVGSVFGLWAIVQGIVAIVAKRGRLWGVLAIILAVVAAIVAGAVYLGVAASSMTGM